MFHDDDVRVRLSFSGRTSVRIFVAVVGLVLTLTCVALLASCGTVLTLSFPVGNYSNGNVMIGQPHDNQEEPEETANRL